MEVRVEATARLHFGFSNLSLSRKRLYGGLGVSLDRPCTVVEARPSSDVEVDGDEIVADYVRKSVELLGVGGAELVVKEEIPRHVGLGSGTQLALAVLMAVGEAHDLDPDPRRHAPFLGRGGRSGAGVALFEDGGFVLDCGHPSELFTRDTPEMGEWSVPPVATRHSLPPEWRFVVVVPEGRGRSGEQEDEGIRRVVTGADSSVTDSVRDAIFDSVLPGIASGDLELFSEGVERVGRLNGVWFSGIQGGVYREESRELLEAIRPYAVGVGQSSWGPAVYGLTVEEGVDEVVDAVEGGVDVYVAEPNNNGSSISYPH